MSIQQNFPAITPSLSLNFARSKKLDPRITFTRTSSATRTNETGLIEVVPANSPRFDHSYDPVSGSVKSLGLLVEESRSNLLTWSEDFSNTGWILQGATLSTNSLTSPSNTLTADKLIDTNTNEAHYVYQQFDFVSGTTYTFSVYAKKAELNHLWIQLPGTQFGVNQWRNFDLTTGDGSAGTALTYSSTNVGNGWWRLTITSTATSSGSGQTQIVLRNAQSGGSSYQGDGTSGIYLWGAQLEEGSFPTSYIPTTNSTVTRTADNVYMVGENFSSWYNQSEGTIYVKHKTYLESNPFNRIWTITDQTSNNVYGIYYPALNNKIDALKTISGSPNFISGISGSANKHNTFNNTMFSYNDNGSSLVTNGGTANTSIVAGRLNLSRLNIGLSEFNIGNYIHLSQLTYYPRRLTNAQLINLTK